MLHLLEERTAGAAGGLEQHAPAAAGRLVIPRFYLLWREEAALEGALQTCAVGRSGTLV